MRESEEYCKNIVAELIDDFADGGEVDIVEQFASLLPAMLIADMLGVPRDKCPTLRRWIRVMVPGGQGPQHVTDEVNDAFGEFCEHHEEMVVERADNPDGLRPPPHLDARRDRRREAR